MAKGRPVARSAGASKYTPGERINWETTTRSVPFTMNVPLSVIRPMNYLALSYDNRIIDGREAVLALVAMKEALEYPVSPLLEA